MAKRQLTPEQLRELKQLSEQCRAWLSAEIGRTRLSVPAIAKAAGMKRSNIYRVQSGEESKDGTPPMFSILAVIQLAKVFGKSPLSAFEDIIGDMNASKTSNSLNAKKAAEWMGKIPAERQPDALDYLQHLASKQSEKRATKKLTGAAAAPRARKARR